MSYIGPFVMIISNGVRTNSADVFNILDPDSGGAATFSVPLSANGLAPASHFGTSTYLQPATHNALTAMTVTEFKAYVDALAVQRGRAPIGSITAFKNNVQISAQGGNFNAFALTLGLLRVQATI